MSNISIPITLAWSPVAVDVQYTTLNELGTLLQSQLSGEVTDNVSFFLTGATPPTTDQGVLFFSTATGYFMQWSDTAGAYVVTGQNIAVGDVLFNATAGDEISRGYFLADGRTIATIPGIYANQVTALTAYYGGATLPTITAPAGGAISKVFGSYPIS
jgi:hypothetical protein